MAIPTRPPRRAASRPGGAADRTRTAPVPAIPGPAPRPDDSEADRFAGGWYGEVRRFKRTLLEAALVGAGGNRTHAARALGLQRTYPSG
jgi:hypothetical protein